MSNQRKAAFPSRIEVDPNYADRTWQIIEHGINQIYNHNDSELSMEDLYRLAYNMVLYKFGEMQYNGLVVTVTRHLEEMRKTIELAQGSFLDELNRKWTDHTKSMQKIQDIDVHGSHLRTDPPEDTYQRTRTQSLAGPHNPLGKYPNSAGRLTT